MICGSLIKWDYISLELIIDNNDECDALTIVIVKYLTLIVKDEYIVTIDNMDTVTIEKIKRLNVTKFIKETICCVCMDNDPEGFINCGHNICFAYSEYLFNDSTKCPLCSTVITNFYKV